MKAITALNLLKKHGFIGANWKIRDLKFFRKHIASSFPLDDLSKWEGVVRHIMMLEYLAGKRDLTEQIAIPEVGFAIGGTIKVDAGKISGGDS